MPTDAMVDQPPTRTGTQFVRFLVVGVGNTMLSFIAYRVLLVVGTPYALAALLAFAVGALNGYIFNRRWTFDARDTTRARVLYVGLQAFGAVATSLLTVAFVRGVSVPHNVAYLASVPPVTVGMFVANRLWTFSERADRHLREETTCLQRNR